MARSLRQWGGHICNDGGYDTLYGRLEVLRPRLERWRDMGVTWSGDGQPPAKQHALI